MTQQQIIQAVNECQTEFLTALKKIITINSVKGPETDDAPFGIGPKQALDATLKLADALGFKTGLVGNAMGYAQLGTNDQAYIAVVGHLDVVHEGTGWHYPPFDLTLDQGVLYGRGILDNKGPILSNLFALAVLKRLDIPLSKTIRIIFGTDEESGSADVPLYLQTEQPPLYGYTPDCKYPAVYGERGVVAFDIITHLTDGSLQQLKTFKGNFDRSAVPDSLTVQLTKESQIRQYTGKRAPSNAPELGLNALTLFAQEATDQHLLTGQLGDYLAWCSAALHQKHYGEGLGIDFADADSGALILTPFNMSLTGEQCQLSLSVRYPISISEETVMKKVSQQLPANSQIKLTRRMPSTVFPKDHPMLAVMKASYELLTGLDGTPVTTTGATYARSMPNIIAFGPSFPGQKGIAHNKDEYMSLNDLMTNMKIYALTLAALAK